MTSRTFLPESYMFRSKNLTCMYTINYVICHQPYCNIFLRYSRNLSLITAGFCRILCAILRAQCLPYMEISELRAFHVREASSCDNVSQQSCKIFSMRVCFGEIDYSLLHGTIIHHHVFPDYLYSGSLQSFQKRTSCSFNT